MSAAAPDRLAVEPAPRTIDRRDIDDRKTKFLSGLGQSRTCRPLIFDLVAQGCDLAFGAAFGNLGFDLRRYLLESLLVARLDLVHL